MVLVERLWNPRRGLRRCGCHWPPGHGDRHPYPSHPPGTAGWALGGTGRAQLSQLPENEHPPAPAGSQPGPDFHVDPDG